MRYQFIFFILFNVVFAFSQNLEPSFKFGEISKEELLLDSCTFYPDADAMVLFRIGDIHFEGVKNLGLVYVLDVHERIKIFTKGGKSYGSNKIRYYKSKMKRYSDRISRFEAFTYNLDGDKIKKTKLDKKDKFINNISKYVEELSYTMPNVQEGSVIDIKYRITSTNIVNLKTWYFQDNIPVKFSKFTYSIPDFLEYKINTLGDIAKLKVNHSSKYISIRYKQLLANAGEFIGKDIMPAELEPYMVNRKSVLSRLEFNLAYYNNKCGFDLDLGTTYEKLNEDLLHSYYFGKRLSKGKFSKKWKSELKNKTKLEKAKYILDKIQNGMSWNKEYSYVSQSAGSKAFKKGEGSVGDINLTLIAALRYNEIEAYPVILMTKKAGAPHPIYPNKWAFNYVIALVKIDDKEYLCDATIDVPFGLIREECINFNGWMVDEKGKWIDLTQNAFKKQTALYNMAIKGDTIYNSITIQLKDYAAYIAYNEYKDETFQENLKKSFIDWDIDKIIYNELNNRSRFVFDISLKKEIDDEDFILIDPFLYETFNKNPFNREERKYNIDFKYKMRRNYIFNLKIPENYELELPDNIKLKMADDGFKFLYLTSQNTEKIVITNRLSSYKTMFSMDEYKALKTFFEKMATFNKQMIILKKNK